MKRTDADLARELTKVVDALDAADRHFMAVAEADAAAHMATTVRPNPLATVVSIAKDDLHRLIGELGEDPVDEVDAALARGADLVR